MDKNQEVALVGIGGSARNVARIHQSEHSYPIGGVHNYTMSEKILMKYIQSLKRVHVMI